MPGGNSLMHYSFIINSTAGNNRSQKKWEELKHYLDSHNIDYHDIFTRYPGHATELARDIANTSTDNEEVIVAVGGDGTIDEVVNGVMSIDHHNAKTNSTPIAVIPTGLTNGFAVAYGIRKNPIQAFQQIESANKTTMISVGQYHESIKDESGFFVNSLGIGFDAALISKRNSKKRSSSKMGLLTFLISAGGVLYNQQPFSLMLQEKHHHQLFPNTYIATCLNHHVRGNKQAMHDNLFSSNIQLLVVEHHNWLITLWTLWLLATGRIAKSRWANYYEADKFQYTTTSLEFVQKDGIELGNRFVDVSISSAQCQIWQNSSFNH